MSRFNPRRPRGRRRERGPRHHFGESVSIHAARAGGDVAFSAANEVKHQFQSTPPARAATGSAAGHFRSRRVSIHAARAGGDEACISCGTRTRRFQSTPPARAATYFCGECGDEYDVSIHAARAGGDLGGDDPPCPGVVSIHAARAGGDIIISSGFRAPDLFQSTPPARAATCVSDGLEKQLRKLFQSTPPARAATSPYCEHCHEYHVSIHAARAGGDMASPVAVRSFAVSIHAARAGGDV